MHKDRHSYVGGQVSLKVSQYVWKYSKHRGTTKLLLLALADFANDSGICWPSANTLSGRIGETERHTRALLKKLVEDGDLIVAPGGGRGNTTKYGIATGMSEGQRSKLNSVLQNTVPDNSVTTETVISGVENSVLQRQETVISGVANEEPFDASASGETTKSDEGIRHEIRNIDPSYSLGALNAPRKQPEKKRNRDPNQQHPACLKFHEKTGYRPNRQQAADIVAAVTDLELWDSAVAAWLGKGHKINDAKGMLDWYLNPARFAPKTYTNGHRNGRSIRQDTGQDSERAQWTAADLADEL